MKERCEAEIRQGWHSARCSNRGKHMRGTMAVCGIHERKTTVALFTGCNCAVHSPALKPALSPSEESGE